MGKQKIKTKKKNHKGFVVIQQGEKPPKGKYMTINHLGERIV